VSTRHILYPRKTHWFSEALFLDTAGCIHDEISIYDMELQFCSGHWFFLTLV
jgi:hypothetical protein